MELICNSLPEAGKQRLEELLEGIENFNLEESEQQMSREPNPYRATVEVIAELEQLDKKIDDYANNLRLLDDEEIDTLNLNDEILP